MNRSTLHLLFTNEAGLTFDADVTLYSKPGSWKFVLIIPQQPDPAIYTDAIREAIRASASTIDPNTVVPMEEDSAGGKRIIDFDLIQGVVTNARLTDHDI